MNENPCPTGWQPGCTCGSASYEPSDKCQIHGDPDPKQCPWCKKFKGAYVCNGCGFTPATERPPFVFEGPCPTCTESKSICTCGSEWKLGASLHQNLQGLDATTHSEVTICKQGSSLLVSPGPVPFAKHGNCVRLMGIPESPKPGDSYRHFKSHVYKVIGVAWDCRFGNWAVVYSDTAPLWVRPLAEFMGSVVRDSYTGPRFSLVPSA
jgi:hypothetical protein